MAGGAAAAAPSFVAAACQSGTCGRGVLISLLDLSDSGCFMRFRLSAVCCEQTFQRPTAVVFPGGSFGAPVIITGQPEAFHSRGPRSCRCITSMQPRAWAMAQAVAQGPLTRAPHQKGSAPTQTMTQTIKTYIQFFKKNTIIVTKFLKSDPKFLTSGPSCLRIVCFSRDYHGDYLPTTQYIY